VLLATFFLLLETFGTTMSVGDEQKTYEEEVVPSVLSKTIGSANKETTSIAELLEASAPEQKLESNNVMRYPTCTDFEDEDANVEGLEGVKTYVTERLKSAERFTEPFKYATYFCNFLPQRTYENITKYWPPTHAFSNYASKSKSCSKFGCRYAMDIGAILKPKGKAGKKWMEHQEARATWELLNGVVFSKEFEEALFDKLGVKGSKIKRREIRVFSDGDGQSNGRVHTDMDAMKVATMMLYVTERTEPMWDYGTCLHTTAQWKKRKKMKLREGGRVGRGDGESECASKFRYLPNTGYAFRVSRDSWHSAPNSRIKHWKGIPRNSILVNWY